QRTNNQAFPRGRKCVQVPLAPQLLVMVRIHVGQPFDAARGARLAHGLRPAYTNDVNALIAEARRMALSEGRRFASKGTCVVYFLRLRSGALYIGVSEDLEQRLDEHASGEAYRTTHLDPPVALVRVEVLSTFTGARNREAQL